VADLKDREEWKDERARAGVQVLEAEVETLKKNQLSQWDFINSINSRLENMTGSLGEIKGAMNALLNMLRENNGKR
jgi:hypothetical protein